MADGQGERYNSNKESGISYRYFYETLEKQETKNVERNREMRTEIDHIKKDIGEIKTGMRDTTHNISVLTKETSSATDATNQLSSAIKLLSEALVKKDNETNAKIQGIEYKLEHKKYLWAGIFSVLGIIITAVGGVIASSNDLIAQFFGWK